jgi:outer membrane protein OmpA-like peptidoglycan-associated protein
MNRLSFATMVMASIGLAACAHNPPQELVDARAEYQRASSGPAQQYRPDEVHKAWSALQAAESSFSSDPDSGKTRDLAYIAERKSQLAEALASAAVAEKVKGDAQNALEQKNAQNAQRTQQQLGQTKEALSETQKQLNEAQQATQQTAAQLAQEQQARAAAEAQAKQANDALSALAAKEEARGMVITLSGSVLFASNQSVLLPEAQTQLNQVADALLQSKEHPVLIEGHTDSRGSAGSNMALSQRRAEAVRDYLVSRGYPSDKVTARGIGPDRPIASNDTAEGRANNRRVEIVVQPALGPASANASPQ